VLLLCLALSIAGGLGTLVSLLGFERLRTWGRIVVVIGFVGIAAVVRWLDRRLAARRLAAGAAAVVLVVVGVLDQTSSRSVPAYDVVARRWEIDRAFVQDAEVALPRGAAILQLPFIPFPESPPVEGMSDYDHARLYLHSDTLRWSYGVVRGRDSWQMSVSRLPLADVLAAARDVCFDAVEVDRAGYADRGADVEAQLAPALGPPIATSADERMALYRLEADPSCPRDILHG
jgi:phosphoglycerol transferase